MSNIDAVVIGGTGIGRLLYALGGGDETIETTFGAVEGRTIASDGRRVLLIQRHSGGHKTPPHKVNYRAMALAAKSSGARVCLSSAAVGSLREDWGPGTLAVCSDMIDLTYRRLTLFDDEVVHTDMSVPFPAASFLSEACKMVVATAQARAVYVGCDGPRYETPAEVRYLRQIGGDIVGMTASSEAIVMKEAGVPYGCLGVVTNLGCGLASGSLDHSEVVDVMKTKGQEVVDIFLRAVSLV